MATTTLEQIREAAHTPAEHARAAVAEYGEGKPLGAYALLAGAYGTVTLAGFASVMARGRLSSPSPSDAALLAVGTFKLTRVMSKAKVTAFLRAPFARFEEEGDGPEVNESPRGSGLRLALGELLTCPFCLNQWTGTTLTLAWLHAPRATRVATSTLAVTSAADVLHVAWCRLSSD